MPRKVRKEISVREEVFKLIKEHSLILGIPLSRIVSYLCLSFLESKDKQKIDHRDIRF